MHAVDPTILAGMTPGHLRTRSGTLRAANLLVFIASIAEGTVRASASGKLRVMRWLRTLVDDTKRYADSLGFLFAVVATLFAVSSMMYAFATVQDSLQ